PHVRSLGAAPRPREHYLAALAEDAEPVGPLDTSRLPAARLAPERPRQPRPHGLPRAHRHPYRNARRP
ncbi:hypothetical protein, partial [Kitasatospora putterlickiae]